MPGVGFLVFLVIVALTYLDIRISKNGKNLALGKTKEGGEQAATAVFSVIASITALVAALLWAFGYFMLEEYGPYSNPGGWIIASWIAFGLAIIMLAISLLAKKVPAFATISNKYPLIVVTALICIALLVEISSCAVSCANHKDPWENNPSYFYYWRDYKG